MSQIVVDPGFMNGDNSNNGRTNDTHSHRRCDKEIHKQSIENTDVVENDHSNKCAPDPKENDWRFFLTSGMR